MKTTLMSVLVILLFSSGVYAKEYGAKSRRILSAVMKQACLHEGTVCYKNFQERLDNYEKAASLLYYSCHEGYRGKPEQFAGCLYRACREYENQMKLLGKNKPANKYKNRYKRS